MTRLELDILDASGNVLGEGPITAVVAASITRKLDGPGEMSLRLPAADKRVQDLIALERRVRLWAFDAGEAVTLGDSEPDYSGATITQSNYYTSEYDGAKCFDNNPATEWITAFTPDGYVDIDLHEEVTLIGYALRASSNNEESMATDWLFQKVDGGLVALDSQAGQPAWYLGERRVFPFAEPVAGDHFRLTVTANEDDWRLNIGEVDLIVAWGGSYVPHTKRLLGVGILRKLSGDAGSLMITPNGPDQLDELRRANTLLGRTYANMILPSVAGNLTALASGWGVNADEAPETAVTARFDGVSALKALQELAARYGQHLRWEDDRELTFGPLGDAAPLRIVQSGGSLPAEAYANDDVAYIDRLTWLDDSEAVANWVIPIGGGQGEAAFTLQHRTRDVDGYRLVHEYSLANRDRWISLRKSPTNKERLAMGIELDAETFIKRARLPMLKVGSPTGTLTLRIETDNAGEPSGTLADANATTTLTESGLSRAGALAEFVFATGFYLDADTPYHLVLSTDRSNSATNYISWGGDKTAPSYADGTMQYYKSSAWSGESPTTDAVFYLDTEVDVRTTAVIDENEEAYTGAFVALKREVSEVSYSGASFSASSSFTGLGPNRAFDGTSLFWQTNTGVSTGWLEVAFPAAKTIRRYAIWASSAGTAPKDWTFEYHNGVTWVALDTQTGKTFAADEVKSFDIASPVSATRYRINVTANGSPASTLRIVELDLYDTTLAQYDALAMSFSSGSDAVRAKRAWLKLGKVGAPSGNLTVSIYANSGGVPSGSALATSEIMLAAELDRVPRRWDFLFSTPPLLSASTTYWLVLETTASADEDNYAFWVTGSGPAFGDAMATYDGASWTELAIGAVEADYQLVAECEVAPYAVQTMNGPDGSTLYYMANAGSIAQYGQIEQVLAFNITPLSHSGPSIELAANALYDAAAAWLDRYAWPQTTYQVTLRKAYASLKPGMKVPLVYRGWVYDRDGNKVTWRNVDDTFWIMAVHEQYGPDGVSTSLELSDVDRARDDLADLILGSIEQVRLSSVNIQPYPTTFTYSYQDMVGAPYTYGRGEGFGDITYGKRARFVLTIDDSILSIQRVKLLLRTRPVSAGLTADDIDGTNAQFNLWYAVHEDNDYPGNISLYIDGVDVTSTEGGPWLTSTGQNEPLNLELDITNYMVDGDIPAYGDHVIEVACGMRTLSSGYENPAVSGYEPWPDLSGGWASPVPTQGVVEATFDLHCTTQAIKLT